MNLLAVDMSPFNSAGPVDDRMQYVYTWIWYGSLLLGVLVFGLLLIAFFRFRRKADDEEPEQVHGNTRLEITWTAIPFAILFALFIVTALNMGFINNASADPSALKYGVEGQQFQWVVTYPNGQKTVNYIFVPQNTPINIDVTSHDVNHSLYLPNLGGQINAIPGQTNFMWIQAKDQGVWYGQCTELCGYGHHTMVVQVVSLSYDKYNACVNTGKSINPKAKNCQPTGAS